MLLLNDSPNPVTATDGKKFTKLCRKNYINITKDISGSKTGIKSVEILICLSLNTHTRVHTQGKVVHTIRA